MQNDTALRNSPPEPTAPLPAGTPAPDFTLHSTPNQVVSLRALRELAHDGSKPKDFRWYQSGHVPSARAWSDSRDWLSGRLGLTRKAP